MLLNNILLALPALAGTVAGSKYNIILRPFDLSLMPLIVPVTNDMTPLNALSPLDPLSGNHIAVIYTDLDCSGSSINKWVNFGCGGQCWALGRASSILLTQQGTGNPKPTANLYNSNNCQGSFEKAGIFSGEHSGCTNANSGQYTWGSAYLYYNC